MVKIPRPEPSVAPSASMMPDLAGSGWGAPGRATQGLGSAIASLGDAFASLDAEAQKEREFQDKLTLVNWSNSVDMNELETRQNYSGDGTDYTLGRQSYFDGSAAEVLQSVSPESRRQAELYIATKRGGYLTGAQRFEGERRQGALTSSIVDTIGLQFSNAAIAAPEDRERAFKAAQEGIDAMINGAPLSEPQKEALRAKAAEHAENMINEFLAEDPNAPLSALPRIERIIDELAADAVPAEGGALEEAPGPQSELTPQAAILPVGGSMAGKRWEDVPTSGGAPRSREWGGPRKGGQHAGIDIPGKTGDPAFALSGGRVLKTGVGQGYGNYVDVLAPDGTVHRFGHLSSINVREGQSLAEGATVGAVGDTGNTKGWPHLHLEVFPNQDAYRKAGTQSSRSGWHLRMDPRQYYGALPGRIGDGLEKRTAALDIPGAQDFTKGRTRGKALSAGDVQNIILHDVSGDPRTRRLPLPKNINQYHVVFDEDGVYHTLPLNRQAPHAASFNGKSIAIAYRGFEGDQLSPKAIENGAKAVKAIADKFGIPPERILTHPGAGPSATRTGGKDKREASWRDQVLAAIGAPPTAEAAASTEAPPVSQRGLAQYAGLGGPKPDGESGALRAPNTIPASEPELDQEPQLVREGQQEIQVADASGRVVPRALPTQHPREIPASSVKTHLRQRLLKKLPAYQRQFEAGVSAAIKQVEDAAAKGYAFPPEQFDVINEAVTKTGNAELRIRLDKAVAGLEITQELMHRSPAEVEMIATKARATLVRDGILTATPDQIGRVEGVEALAKTMRKELDDNPIGWGVHTGIIPEVTPITPETLSIDVLAQRAASGRAVADYYGQPPKFFLPEERLVLKAFLEKGGPNMVRLLGGMYEAFGNDMPWAMKEISKDAPEAATLGWLISSGVEPKTITDVSEAIALRATPEGEKIFKALTPSQDQARLAAVSVNGKAFLGLPEAEQRAIDLANALYVVRAQRKGLSGEVESWDADLWRQAFNEVLGQTTDPRTDVTYGGLTDQGVAFGSWRNRPGNHGVKAIVPPNIRTDALPDLIDALRITDLVEGGMPGGTPDLGLKMSAAEKQSLARAKEHAKQTGLDDVDRNLVPRATRGAPIDNMGRLITVGAFRRATLVTIGDGRYWMALGNPLSDDPQWIGSHDTPDGRYVLDLK